MNQLKPEFQHHHIKESNYCESKCSNENALSQGDGLVPGHQHHNHSRECCCPASTVADSVETTSLPLPEGANRVRYRIVNMDCPTEEQLIRNKLEPMTGIIRLDFNLLERELTVYHKLKDPQLIASALTKLDMAPSLLEGGGPQPDMPSGLSAIKKGLLVISGIAAVGAEVIAWTTGQDTSWPVLVSMRRWCARSRAS